MYHTYHRLLLERVFPTRSDRDMIYFLQHLKHRYIKIGTTVHLRSRLVQLCEEYGDELTLLGIMDGTRETERRLHYQFDHIRRFSEWLRPGPELLAFIEKHARPFPFDTVERRLLPARTYEKQQRARRLYYAHPDGLSDSELAELLHVSRMTAYRYRQQLQAVKVRPGRYCLVPRPEEITEALGLLHIAISAALLDPHAVFSVLQSKKNRSAPRVTID